jgi:hypothetical protein
MSVAYGSPAGGYAPPGRVNFGWIGEAWQYLNGKAGTWILAILLYGIISNAVNALIILMLPNPHYVPLPGLFSGSVMVRFGISYGMNSNVTALGQILGGLFSWIFGSFQNASLYGMAVKQVRGGVISFSDAFGGGTRFVQMLLLNLILFFLYALGVIALCVGALVVAAFLLPAQALVADGRSATEAVSQSVAGMKQDWLNAILFIFVFFLLIVASIIPCGLGLFVTIPMLHIVGALAYRDMIGMPGLGVPASPYGAAPYGAPAAPGVWPPPPGQAPLPGPPPPYGQPPSFGQSTPPPVDPPRRTLGGDLLDEDGNTPPPRSPPPGGTPLQ